MADIYLNGKLVDGARVEAISALLNPVGEFSLLPGRRREDKFEIVTLSLSVPETPTEPPTSSWKTLHSDNFLDGMSGWDQIQTQYNGTVTIGDGELVCNLPRASSKACLNKSFSEPIERGTIVRHSGHFRYTASQPSSELYFNDFEEEGGSSAGMRFCLKTGSDGRTPACIAVERQKINNSLPALRTLFQCKPDTDYFYILEFLSQPDATGWVKVTVNDQLLISAGTLPGEVGLITCPPGGLIERYQHGGTINYSGRAIILYSKYSKLETRLS